MIKLTIQKNTFEKHLSAYGYNYKIVNYDEFIETLQSIAFYKLSSADNLEETVNEIFSVKPDISFMFDKKNISFIKKEFLFSLIESGQLYLFFEDKNETFSPEVIKTAFFIAESNRHFLSGDFDFSSSSELTNIKAKRYLSENNIDLDDPQFFLAKYSIYEEIFSSFGFLEVDSLDHFNLFQYATKFDENAYFNFIKKLAGSNFIFSDKLDMNVVLPKELEYIFGYFSYFSSSSTISNAIRLLYKDRENHLRYSDLKREFDFMHNSVSEKQQDKFVKALIRFSTLSDEEMFDISIEIINEKNSFLFKITDILA